MYNITPLRQPTRYTCAATCAAMLTGTTVEDFIAWVGRDGESSKTQEPGFRFDEIMQYCAQHGFFQLPVILNETFLSGVPVTGQCHYTYMRYHCIIFTHNHNGGLHCVLYVPERVGRVGHVLDPEFDEPRELRDYVVNWVMPMVKYQHPEWQPPKPVE